MRAILIIVFFSIVSTFCYSQKENEKSICINLIDLLNSSQFVDILESYLPQIFKDNTAESLKREICEYYCSYFTKKEIDELTNSIVKNDIQNLIRSTLKKRFDISTPTFILFNNYFELEKYSPQECVLIYKNIQSLKCLINTQILFNDLLLTYHNSNNVLKDSIINKSSLDEIIVDYIKTLEEVVKTNSGTKYIDNYQKLSIQTINYLDSIDYHVKNEALKDTIFYFNTIMGILNLSIDYRANFDVQIANSPHSKREMISDQTLIEFRLLITQLSNLPPLEGDSLLRDAALNYIEFIIDKCEVEETRALRTYGLELLVSNLSITENTLLYLNQLKLLTIEHLSDLQDRNFSPSESIRVSKELEKEINNFMTKFNLPSTESTREDDQTSLDRINEISRYRNEIASYCFTAALDYSEYLISIFELKEKYLTKSNPGSLYSIKDKTEQQRLKSSYTCDSILLKFESIKFPKGLDSSEELLFIKAKEFLSKQQQIIELGSIVIIYYDISDDSTSEKFALEELLVDWIMSYSAFTEESNDMLNRYISRDLLFGTDGN